MTRAALVSTLLLSVSTYANAQGCLRCGAPDTLRRSHVVAAWGVHVGEPQKASAALGVILGEDWQSKGRDHSRNVALYAEPGIAAGRASIAYLDQGYGSFGSGFGIAASVLRAWDDPWVAKQNVTYVGGELLLWPIVFVGPRVGLFHSVTGPSGSQKWFVSFDFGVGL
ncbi:MAG TPA: hypothetical protein VN600_12850 [Gemmatimonadaceae bacterium]|nr:hypothetical protein [Gemmatimonadaceae bacterium]